MANQEAWSQGWAIGQNAAQHSRDRKEMLTDEQHAIKRDDLLKNKDAIVAQLSNYKDANGDVIPEYKGQYDKAIEALNQNQYEFGQLYDPIKAPGKLQQDWHYLREKIHGIKPPPSTISQTPAMIIPEGKTAPITTPELPSYQQVTRGLPSQGVDQAEIVAGVAPTTVPRMLTAPIVLPAGPATTVTQAKEPYKSPKELKKTAQARHKAQEDAQLLASTAGPSPAQQAIMKARTDAITKETGIDFAMKSYENLFPSATQEDKDRFKNTLIENAYGGKASTLIGKWDRVQGKMNGQPTGLLFNEKTGEYRYSTGESVPQELLSSFVPDPKQTKPTRGGLVKSKQSPTGFAQTYVDPYNPSKVVGWIPVTPSRYYQGVTNTRTSTDSLGVTTTSSGTTQPLNQADVDLSNFEQLPADLDGTGGAGVSNPSGQSSSASSTVATSPTNPPWGDATPRRKGPSVASPKERKTPSQIKKAIPSPPQTSTATGGLFLDAQGHIPENAPYNKGLIQIANDIIDGQDVTKIPLKDRGAAQELASKYGWKGQGLFTPKEELLLKESQTYLDKAMKDPAMKVLDSKESRIKIANAIHAAGENAGILSKAMSIEFGLTPEENDFVSMYLQLIGTISGLGQLTRGGRMTEATAKRLMNELPSPLLTPNSKAGIDKLKRLRSEINVATQKGAFDLSQPSDKNPAGGMTYDQFVQKHFGGQNAGPQ